MPICLATLLCDLVLGEPPNRFHPTVWLGRLVSFLESRLYVRTPERKAKILGALLVAVAVLTAGASAALLEIALLKMLPLPFALLGIALAASLTIACRSLAEHALPPLRALCRFRTDEARTAVAKIVGRDVQKLDRGEISRAGVEAVAESLGDGIVAPLFWFALLGLPGAFVYRVANTMDSMLGHKDERYENFGWAAARFDDLLNFLPARILAIPSVAFGALCVKGPKAAKSAAQAGLKFHAEHKSPNAGWYEAAFAGALDVRLGGTNFYDGERVDCPLLNAEAKQATPRSVKQAVATMILAAFFSALALDAVALAATTILKELLP